jgi:putative sporulation protein YtaF
MTIIKFLFTSITIFLVALTLSVDDFSVGIAYGLHKVRLPLKNLVFILLGSATSTWGIMLLGKFIFTSIPKLIADVIGFIILSTLGGKMIYQGWADKKDSEQNIESRLLSQDTTKSTNLRQSLSLGLALGIDDFAEALGLGVAGFPVVLTVLFLEVAELIAILSGNYLAFKGLSKKMNRKLSILPGIVLVFIALYQLFF